jgi:hypothetical protein
MRDDAGSTSDITVQKTIAANGGMRLPIGSLAFSPLTELDDQLLPIREALDRVPRRAIEIAEQGGIRMYVLGIGERYRAASPTFDRRGIDVDAWPVPPAGLFIVEERTVYLRSTSPVSIVHELGHGLDCALGNGVYRSGYDPEIRRAFRRATSFVTPYAGSSVDEFFAECFRAYVEVNEPGCLWPDVSRERLAFHSPEMSTWFDREIGRECATITAA